MFVILAYSSVVLEHPAVNRSVAGSSPAMSVAFVVAGSVGGLREINPQKNRNSVYAILPCPYTLTGE